MKVDGSHPYRAVVDAASGRTLLRRNLVQSANASVHRNYPGAAVGGAAVTTSLDPWLAPGATTLTGPNVHAFADVNDDDFAAAGEEIPHSTGTDYLPVDRPSRARAPTARRRSSARGLPDTAFNYQTNLQPERHAGLLLRQQLPRPARRRRRSASRRRPATSRRRDDPVHAQRVDGANTRRRLPRRQPHRQREHVDATRRQSRRRCRCTCSRARRHRRRPVPRVQRRRRRLDRLPRVHPRALQPARRRRRRRLDARQLQAGAMGEAWSDWYAMDFLVAQGCVPGHRRARRRPVGEYVADGAT